MSIFIFIFIFIFVSLLLPQTLTLTPPIPTPTPWPLQFHALLYANYSTSLSLIDLYYDFPNGLNANLIRYQLASSTFFDIEWTNGTSFFFSREECRTVRPGVGILRPDWMDGAKYLGREMVDGFECDVWEKVEFVWYYEDVITKRPVHWLFYTGRSIHVMTYEVGVVLEDEKRQAPAYCFNKLEKEVETKQGQRHLGAFDAGDNDLRSLASMTTTYSNQ